MLPRVAPLALASLLVVVAVAGCIDDQPDISPDDLIDALEYYTQDVFPVDTDHDHADGALHNATLNFMAVYRSACASSGDGPGGFTDIAFHHPYAYVGNRLGFCVLDVTDPAHPEFVSQYAGEPAADIEVSFDGNYVFLPTQRNRLTSLADQTDNPAGNLPRGVQVVNVKNKEGPVFESYYPVPTNGVHTAVTYQHGTRQIVFINTYDWVPPAELLPPGVNPPVPTSNAPITQRVEITELIAVQGKMLLQRLATWSLPRPVADPLELYFPHDGFAQFHPATKQHLYYIAYWDAGLVVLNIDDPSKPSMIGQYNDIDPSVYNQYHDVKVFPDLIDGKHITVTGPELSSGPEAGHVRVFDTTDPSMPVQLGTWRLPGNPGTPGGFLFSPHVFTLNEGRIYIGHNHGGVWVIDVHNETLLKQPASAGYYFPPSPSASGVWGAYVHMGYVYATEASTGVHVLHFAADEVAAPDEPGDGHEHA